MNSISQKAVIRKILGKLIDEEGYTQMDVFQKLKLIEHHISRASISNLRNDKPGVSLPLLKKASRGLEILLQRDLCICYDHKHNKFQKISGCVPRPIFNRQVNEDTSAESTTSLKFQIHEGRLDVPDKVAFYQQAIYEIIEIGIGLRSFTSYFSSKRESAFYEPIMQKLKQGVNFKCYVLDPEGSFLRRYMEDRSVIFPQELDVLGDIPKIVQQLRKLFLQINRKGYEGTMELYTYNHFPYYHASVVDGDTEAGATCISSYLFGVTRANSPVIEVSRKNNPVLYRKYWRSIKAIIDSNRTIKIV